MKSSKCLLLLAALVGFGLVGKSNAALLSSIEITSPDSGALVGIDSKTLHSKQTQSSNPAFESKTGEYLVFFFW